MESLEAGVRIAIAPRFHDDRARADRLRVNSGTIEVPAGFAPRDDWRPATVDELALLDARPEGDAFPDGALALFTITEPLRARWWSLAAALSAGWFEAYAADVVGFVRYKGLPLPTTCRLDVLVNDVGPDSLASGLAFNMDPTWPPLEEPAGPRLLGGINLGDEPTGLAILNLSAARMVEILRDGGDRPATLDELTRAFLGRFPGYPMVRVALGPGDGFWLPREGLVFVGELRAKSAPDVMLMIRG